MVRYYKLCDDKYIYFIGTGGKCGEEIKKEEYDTIMNIIRKHRKETKADIEYRLTLKLEWEEVQPPETTKDGE